MTEDNYGDLQYWFDALSGNKPEIHEGRPQCGYYRARLNKDTPMLPVAIWRDEHSHHCLCKVGYQHLYRIQPATEIWTWCADKPVKYGDYLTACTTHVWPAEDHSAILDEVEAVVATAEDGGALEDLWKRVDAARMAANRHALELKRTTDALFKTALNKVKDRMKQLKAERDAA